MIHAKDRGHHRSFARLAPLSQSPQTTPSTRAVPWVDQQTRAGPPHAARTLLTPAILPFAVSRNMYSTRHADRPSSTIQPHSSMPHISSISSFALSETSPRFRPTVPQPGLSATPPFPNIKITDTENETDQQREIYLPENTGRRSTTTTRGRRVGISWRLCQHRFCGPASAGEISTAQDRDGQS